MPSNLFPVPLQNLTENQENPCNFLCRGLRIILIIRNGDTKSKKDSDCRCSFMAQNPQMVAFKMSHGKLVGFLFGLSSCRHWEKENPGNLGIYA